MSNLTSLPDPRKLSTLRLAARVIGVVVVGVALLVLFGWAAHIEPLLSVLPGMVTMKVNTAVSLTSCGVALFLLNSFGPVESCPARWRTLAFGLSMVPVLIGIATVLEYVLGADFHIDQLVLPDFTRHQASYHPGRMSPVTAANFVFLGGSIMCLAGWRPAPLTQLLASGSGFLSLVVLTGTSYGINAVLGTQVNYAAVAVHTNFCFMLIFAGILSTTGEHGVMRLLTDSGAAGKVLRRMLPTAILIPLFVSSITAVLERAGVFSLELGISIFSITTIVAFTGLVWWSGVFLHRSEGRTHASDARLDESLRRYAFLADTMPQIIWTAKPDGSTDYFNRRWFDYTGLTPEQSKDWGWKPVIHPDDLPNCLVRWTKAFTTGGDYEVEYRFKRHDGVYRWHLGRAFPLRDESGAIIHWVGTCTDIEEQKQARVELEQRVADRTAELSTARARLQSVLDSATQVAIIAVDPQGHITLFNRGAEQMFGYRAEEIVGRHTPAILHVEWEVAARAKEMSEKYGRAIRGIDIFVENAKHGHHEEREWTLVRKDGSPVPVNLIITAMRDSAGAITGFLGIVTDISARKKAERQLQGQARLLDLANEAILIRDISDLVTYWNQGAERFYGWTKEEAQGRVTHELFQTIFPMPLPQIQAELLETGSWQGEVIHIRRDGTVATVSSNWTLQRDGSGLPVSVIEINHDITGRKRVEETLRASEERFRLVVDAVEDYALVMLNPNGYIVSWNAGAQRIKGYTTADIIGRHFSQFYLPEDIQAGRPERNLKVAREKGHYTEEAWRVRKDGSRFLAEVNIRAIYDEKGVLRGFAKVTRNITDRKKAEEEVTRSRERLNTILNSSFDGIIVYEAVRGDDGKIRDFRFSMVNVAAEKLMSAPAAEIVGRTVLEKFPNVIADGFLEKFIRIVEDGAALDFEILSSRTDPPRWYRVAGVKLGDGLVISYADITVRKLYERELQDAKLHAETADRAKSHFLANMSHEIRTPMNGVIGLAGLLLDTHLDTEQRNLTETIRGSAESLLVVINDILDFSKIEAGKLTFEEIDFDLRKVVEDALEVMAGLAQGKGLELAGGIEPGTVTQLRGDPTRVQQVLTNLIGNALKFTSRGEVAVNVHTEAQTESRVVIRCDVRDTGRGISSEVQARLFQPFVQADTSTSREFGGTGLGLAICKRLAEAMNGSVSVKSEPGQGSTFSVTMEFPRQDTPAAELTAPDLIVDSHVLVVDDNPTSREFLHRQIVAWHLHNGCAANAEEALARLRHAVAEKTPYQVALVDLQMPGKDGLALAQLIQADAALRDTRVILLTPIGKPVPSSEIAPANIAGCCAKPVRQSALFDCLMQAMSQPAGSGVVRPAEPRAKALVTAPKRKERILLAEDNAVNQEVALGNLTKLGYHADVALNGLEVLYAIESRKYDIILMDCQMPELDGYETTRQIRLRERGGRRTRIIAMTANAMVGDREKCLAAGMDDYVSKPLRRAELRAALERNSPKPAVPFNEKILRGIVEDDSEIARIVEIFLATSPESVRKMHVALAAKNAADLALAAHALKGSCGSLGATTLRELCAQLELNGREGLLEGAEELIASAEKELHRLSEALQSYIQSRTAV